MALNQLDHVAVKAARMALGWSEERLAAEANISYSSVRKYENGTTQPSLPVAARMAKALGISLSDLVLWDTQSAVAA